MSELINLSFSFKGADADRAVIDMYDGARAIAGFHRSLAITTHLILNDEIITQAPSLKGASIYMPAPEAGSWKTTAMIAVGTLSIAAGTASTDSLFGHLVASSYAYVTNEALGFDGDYEDTLQKQIRDYNGERGTKLDVPDSMASLKKWSNRFQICIGQLSNRGLLNQGYWKMKLQTVLSMISQFLIERHTIT